jgi:hypothetical protein
MRLNNYWPKLTRLRGTLMRRCAGPSVASNTGRSPHLTRPATRATWAAVPARYVEGVQNFLLDQLDPIIRSSLCCAAPVPVNLPQEKAS